MTPSVTQSDSPIWPPKGLVCVKFTSAKAKQDFLKECCNELPPGQNGHFPSRRFVKNAKVVVIGELQGSPLEKIDQFKTVIRQTPNASQRRFVGPLRQRLKK